MLKAAIQLFLVSALLLGCGYYEKGGYFISTRYGYRVLLPPKEWEVKADEGDIPGLEEPSLTHQSYLNPHTGGRILVQVRDLPRRYRKLSLEELADIVYKRFLFERGNDMRVFRDGHFLPLEEGLSKGERDGLEYLELSLKGSFGKRLTGEELAERRRERERLLPFGPPMTRRLVKEEKRWRLMELKPLFTGNYRGEVVLFRSGKRLFEFYYFDHELAYESGIRGFRRMVESFSLTR